VQRRFELGAVSQTDVLSQRTSLAVVEATLPPLQKALAQTRHQLSVYVGILPSDNHLPEFRMSSLQLPEELPVSLPSTLVRQRPDILASEALMHEASANIGVATSKLLPTLNLSASAGSEALTLETLFNSLTNTWSLAGSITQPLFHGGALFAQRRASIAAFDAAAAEYKQTVLVAFQNVADSLRALETDARGLKISMQAEQDAKSLLSLTTKQYELGAVSYLSLLNAEQQYQQAHINRVQAESLRFADTAALFQALGGSWFSQDEEG